MKNVFSLSINYLKRLFIFSCLMLYGITITAQKSNISNKESLSDTMLVIANDKSITDTLGFGSMNFPYLVGNEFVYSDTKFQIPFINSSGDIQTINNKRIKTSSSGDYYYDLGNLVGVDIISSSLDLNMINCRGFGSNVPYRYLYYVDGIDNQSPSFNYPFGKMIDASELDIESIELLSGPSSSLYGSGAMQGVVNVKTKDPFLHKGLSGKVKGGSRNLIEGHFRYSNPIDKAEKLALKLTFSQMQVDDWLADNQITNSYGNEKLGEFDLNQIIHNKSFDPILSQNQRNYFIKADNYIDSLGESVGPGIININAPGYMQANLKDPLTRNTKMSASLHYKVMDSLRLSYQYKYGSGSAVIQNYSRYYLKNIRLDHHNVTLKGKDFFLRAYITKEEAGDSYNMALAASRLNSIASIEYKDRYIEAYLDSSYGLGGMTNQFEETPAQWMIDSAHLYAQNQVLNTWLIPGNNRFDSAFSIASSNTILNNGSRFISTSSISNLDGQYNCSWSFVNLVLGATYRAYNPQSFGTIFEDTLLNFQDTLTDGSINTDGAYNEIFNYEFGAYTQLSLFLFKRKLKLIGAFRYDLSNNFKPQISPKIAAVLSNNRHKLHIAGQLGYRYPSLKEQYLSMDMGSVFMSGNLRGSANLSNSETVIPFYTQSSVSNAITNMDTVLSDLTVVTIAPIQPEYVRSLDIGYTGILSSRVCIQVKGHYSLYNNCIRNAVYVKPNGDAVAGEASGTESIINGKYTNYQVPVNITQDVITYGGSLAFAYRFGKGFFAITDYSYLTIEQPNTSDPSLSEFNAPKFKFHIGISGEDVWRRFGFSADYKWVEGFVWSGISGKGKVPNYDFLNLQLSYRFKDLNSTFRIGGANLFENFHVQTYGGPTIGRFLYASWTFDIYEL